jgi:hypothetical protein
VVTAATLKLSKPFLTNQATMLLTSVACKRTAGYVTRQFGSKLTFQLVQGHVFDLFTSTLKDGVGGKLALDKLEKLWTACGESTDPPCKLPHTFRTLLERLPTIDGPLPVLEMLVDPSLRLPSGLQKVVDAITTLLSIKLPVSAAAVAGLSKHRQPGEGPKLTVLDFLRLSPDGMRDVMAVIMESTKAWTPNTMLTAAIRFLPVIDELAELLLLELNRQRPGSDRSRAGLRARMKAKATKMEAQHVFFAPGNEPGARGLCWWVDALTSLPQWRADPGEKGPQQIFLEHVEPVLLKITMIAKAARENDMPVFSQESLDTLFQLKAKINTLITKTLADHNLSTAKLLGVVMTSGALIVAVVFFLLLGVSVFGAGGGQAGGVINTLVVGGGGGGFSSKMMDGGNAESAMYGASMAMTQAQHAIAVALVKIKAVMGRDFRKLGIDL